MITTAAVAAPVRATAEPTPDPSPSVSPSDPPGPTPGGTASATPSPTPTPTSSPTASPTPTHKTTAPSTDQARSAPDPSRPASPTASASSSAKRLSVRSEATSRNVSLSVSPLGSPVAGQFFHDIGSFGFAGTISPAAPDRRVEIWYLRADDGWHRTRVTSTDDSGHFKVTRPVTVGGLWHFRATLGGRPASSSTVQSSDVPVTVHGTRVDLSRPDPTIDSLTKPSIHGSVYPAMAGVRVHFQVRRATGDWHNKAAMMTRKDGKFSFTFSTGAGRLRKYYVRARRWDPRADAWVTSHAAPITRTRVLHAVVTRTTAAQVADTYHAGCPVGPKKLRTIRLNYYGRDKLMHRGMIIVAAGRVNSVKAAFRDGLRSGFRIRRMTNPNHWGGSDPKQMEADNTSGFNCRKVTGNPYAQSPHSYGIAIDVNTRENPYRDVTGKWWPKSGRSYIKRKPWRQGMLTVHGRLTEGFRNRGYFWGGFWNPGKDYQHFEYDK